MLETGESLSYLLKYWFCWREYLIYMRRLCFLDQAGQDFKHVLDSIFMDSTENFEINVSFEKCDAAASLVSLGLICLVYPVSDNSELELTPSIKFQNWNHCSRPGLCCLYCWQVKCRLPSIFTIFPLIPELLVPNYYSIGQCSSKCCR